MLLYNDLSPGDEPPIRVFRRFLRSMEREVELSLATQTECCGVTSAQCHLLLEIEYRGVASVGELAEALEVDPSTLSRAAESLVKSGLISRSEDPGNRRKVKLQLSDAGRAKVDEINAMCDEYYGQILDGDRVKAITEVVAYLAGAIRAKRMEGLGCGSPRRGREG